MTKEQAFKALINIYTDYFDGLYTKAQLQFMIKQVQQQLEINTAEFAEMLLEAQWHEASEEDYEKTRQANKNN